MAVLVCGGAGYIGSHVNKELHRRGYETVVYDSLIRGHRDAVKWGDFVQGDLADVNALEDVFQRYPIEAVFHFAAFAYVGESVEKPEMYYRNNVMNTLNLLMVMRKYACRKIVFSSTCATYGEPDRIPITEDMDQKPVNPYGVSKLMVERILQDYERAYGMEYMILRYFNATGADPDGEIGENHQPETHLIPLILEVAEGKKRSVQVFGGDYPTTDGSCVRDYIHVSDLADAHLLALRQLEMGKGSACFNLGNGCGFSVLEIVEAASKVTGKHLDVVICERRPGDPAVLVGSSDKAKCLLGWAPRYTDVETMIAHSWNWYRKMHAHA
ncbi:MAG: UDP-glucose 4-epimerase GalE [Selenomonadaceae bacterium]|nr:UDP-glucose 4-epimerase GalE [Selenomonadaceae bacterium]